MAARPRVNQQIREALLAVPVGCSFFLSGFTKADVQRVRNVALSLKMRVSVRRLSHDEIYMVPGVRVWVEENSAEVDLDDF